MAATNTLISLGDEILDSQRFEIPCLVGPRLRAGDAITVEKMTDSGQIECYALHYGAAQRTGNQMKSNKASLRAAVTHPLDFAKRNRSWLAERCRLLGVCTRHLTDKKPELVRAINRLSQQTKVTLSAFEFPDSICEQAVSVDSQDTYVQRVETHQTAPTESAENVMLSLKNTFARSMTEAPATVATHAKVADVLPATAPDYFAFVPRSARGLAPPAPLPQNLSSRSFSRSSQGELKTLRTHSPDKNVLAAEHCEQIACNELCELRDEYDQLLQQSLYIAESNRKLKEVISAHNKVILAYSQEIQRAREQRNTLQAKLRQPRHLVNPVTTISRHSAPWVTQQTKPKSSTNSEKGSVPMESTPRPRLHVTRGNYAAKGYTIAAQAATALTQSSSGPADIPSYTPSELPAASSVTYDRNGLMKLRPSESLEQLLRAVPNQLHNPTDDKPATSGYDAARLPNHSRWQSLSPAFSRPGVSFTNLGTEADLYQNPWKD